MKSDWSIKTTGGWAVLADYSVSPNYSLQCISGESQFLYTTRNNILDTRITAPIYIPFGGSFGSTGLNFASFYARINSQSNWFGGAGSGYRLDMRKHPTLANSFAYSLTRLKLGSATGLMSTFVISWVGAGSQFWNWRWSVTGSGATVTSFLEIYDGSVWQPIHTYNDTNANRITAAGYAGLGASRGFFKSQYMDDVLIEEDI